MKAAEVASVKVLDVPAPLLPRTIFPRLVGLAPKVKFRRLEPSKVVSGGGPGGGVAPPGNWKSREGQSGPSWNSPPSHPPVLCSCVPVPTERTGPRPPGLRVGATPKLPPLDSLLLHLDATEANAWGHIQVPLVPPYFSDAGLFFLALNRRQCQPDSKTVVRQRLPGGPGGVSGDRLSFVDP